MSVDPSDEQEPGNPGDQPDQESPESPAATGENSFRPFRSWASSYEEQSVLERVWKRIAAPFRKRPESAESADAPQTTTPDPASDITSDVNADLVPDTSAVAPPDDFRFPWTRRDADLTDVDAQSPTGSALEEFSSVDEALPPAEDAPALAAPENGEEKKSGLFSRLFRGGKDKEKRNSLEIEVHEDRIQAAEQALDQVGEEQFESFEGRSTTDDAFVTVDEALPAELDVVEEKVVEEEVVDAAGAMTLDETPAVQRPVFDGATTLDLDRKTDEFAAITEPPDEPVRTLELKKNWWSDSFIGRMFKRGDTQIETAAIDAHAAARMSPDFLLAKFRAFYNEVIRFQHQKSEFTAGFATAIIADASSDVSPDAAAEGLSKRLCELLELQAAEAKWMGGEAGERYPDAAYVMAALADELFTHFEWDGQSAWAKHKIELRMHRTNAAEVDVFRRIDRLLKESPDSVVARDLARVYLLVLAAGFQGKWRPFGLVRPLAEYRRRLYEFIHAGDPLMLYAADRKVFPDAASRTLEGHAVARFTAMQRWAAILVLLLAGYTVAAHLMWNSVSADLKDVTSRIRSANASVSTAAGGETR